MRAYRTALHNMVDAEELPETVQARHPRWYAFAVQVILTSATALGLLMYELQTTTSMPWDRNLVIALSLVLVCILAVRQVVERL